MNRFRHVLVGVALVGAMTLIAPQPVAAVPGSPGVPQLPARLYEETFQALLPSTANNVPVAIGNYRFTDRTTGALVPYYADPAWNAGSGNCNGWVLNFNSAVPNPGDGCASANGGATGTGQETSWWFLQRMAAFLGYMTLSGGYEMGPADYMANNVVASQTNGGTAGNNYRQPAGIQAQAHNVVMTEPGHYYAVAVDFAEVHCPNFPGGNSNWYAASETLYLEINGVFVPMIGDGTPAGGVNICKSPATQIVQPNLAMTGIAGWQSTYFAYTHLVSGAYQATISKPLGLRVYNAQVNAIGNDVAFDNVQIVDVTPQVDKAFAPQQIAAGQTSRLTWTITNTADRDAKSGFSFTDTLPVGVVAIIGSGTTTCNDPVAASPNGTVAVSADGTAVTVTGNLATRTDACTASVLVTSATVGTYLNDGSNLTTRWGIIPPDTCAADCPTPPAGGDTLTVVSNPALTLAKSAFTGATSPGGLPLVTEADQPIVYTLTITNSGDVPVDSLALVDDSFTGDGTLGAPACAPTDLGGTLAPGAATTCLIGYTATQADIDAGGTIDNSATASGHGLGQAPGVTTTSNTATATVAVQPGLPSMVLLKTLAITDAGGTAQPIITGAGDLLHYTFTVTNTGVTTIADLAIQDGTSDDYTGVDSPGFSGTGTLSPIDCDTTTLAPGATATCTTTYTVQLDDLDLAEVLNAARATGTDSQGQPVVSNVSATRATTGGQPALGITKTHLNTALRGGTVPIDLSTTPALPGDVVTFEFTVTNTGNTLLTKVGVSDSLINIESPIECPEGARGSASLDGRITLEAGEQVVCAATYTLSQADIDAGQVINLQAQADGIRTETTTDPGTGEQTTVEYPVFSEYASNELPLPAQGAVTLVKDETLPPGGVTAAGQTVAYSFRITNTGNVTLKDLRISDPALAYVDTLLPGFSGTGVWTWTMAICPQTALGAGQSETCYATYVVTQADVDRGSLKNTATVSGVAPPGAIDAHGVPVTTVTSGPSHIEFAIPPDPQVSLAKAASPASVSTPGAVVTYTYTVTNDGNVTLTDPQVTERLFSGSGTWPAPECPSVALAPGASVDCWATYTVTPADLEAGQIKNTATASGVDPALETQTSAPSSSAVAAQRLPALTLVKSSAQPSYAAGGPVVYTFSVTNTGNVIVDGIFVADDHTTGNGVMGVITCPVQTLAPGASTLCTGTYTATQEDVDRGEILNYAIAHGVVRATDGPVSSYQQSFDIPAVQTPSLSLDQTVSTLAASITTGTDITFHLTITNTGKVTVTGLRAAEQVFSGSDPVPPVSCPVDPAAWPSGQVGVLAPGQVIECWAPYTVTAVDAAAGTVEHTATMTGDAALFVRGLGLNQEPVLSNPATAGVLPLLPLQPHVQGEAVPTGGWVAPGSGAAGVFLGGVLVIAGLGGLLRRRLG